jgi:hypothetical protein
VVLALVELAHMLLERKELTQHFQLLQQLAEAVEALLVVLEMLQLLVVLVAAVVCVCKHHLMAQAQREHQDKVLQVEMQQHPADTLAAAEAVREQ